LILTIPISLIVSFIYLFVTDGSLNVISLASLSIALGMVVDDAIVVLENISRHIERGTSPREAAIYATNEVWLSVIVTTLVIVAVFFPLTLVPGHDRSSVQSAGMDRYHYRHRFHLCGHHPYPDASSQLLELKKRVESPAVSVTGKPLNPFLSWLEGFYEKTLRVALRNKKKVVIAALAVFIGSLFLLRFHKHRFYAGIG
jgi:hydrophobic/amphiphilic exporter-1 (mainly G- bacteria), HAE1 family